MDATPIDSAAPIDIEPDAAALPPEVQRGPVLVISPHLDDGIFSCGGLLGSGIDATVVTVFAGKPPQKQPLTDWDRACGFGPDSDVMGCRRDEDQAALDVVGARPAWIEFLDAQYGKTPSCKDIVLQLRMYLALLEPDSIFFPLGLFHSDHCLVHEAALMLMDHGRHCRWLAYEDVPYRKMKNLRDARISALHTQGFELQPLRYSAPADAMQRKRKAVACYKSQLRAFSEGSASLDTVFDDEVYWHLIPPRDHGNGMPYN